MEFYKKLLDEINKVRKNPKAFAGKLLGYKQYFEGNFLVLPGSDAKVETQEGFKVYEEAANILKSTAPLPELTPSKGLGKISADFFEKIKETDPDNIGDIDLNSIIAKYGSFSGIFENIIEFGNNSPKLIVTNCIVCDGDPERENRNILLSKDLLKVGMAFGVHVTYGYCTIIISCTEFKNVDNSNDLDVMISTFGTNAEDVDNSDDFDVKIATKGTNAKDVDNSIKLKKKETKNSPDYIITILKLIINFIIKKPRTRVVIIRNVLIKNLIEDNPKNILNKYFNIWKHKKLPEDEVEKIIKENKKKIIKRRIINLQKKINEEVPKEESSEEEIPKEEEPKVLRGKISKKEPEKPEEEEVKPKSDEIPKIEVIVIDKEAPVEEVPKTSVYTLRISPKTRVVKKKNIVIKNLLQNIDKTTLFKYFNVWKYEELSVDEVEEISKKNKKKK